MISVLILDDDVRYLDKVKGLTGAYFSQKGLSCKIEICQNADWVLSGIKEARYDIYVLDIDMPQKNGMEVAREIRKVYPDPIIIFLTNFVDYAIEAYEVSAWRYIPKEAMDRKLPEGYDALLPRLLEKEKKSYIIEKKSDLEKICYDDIWYLKKEGRYTVITHLNGKSRVRKSLSDVFGELNSSEFIMIDKGVIVNIRNVMNLKEHVLQMRDGTKLVVGSHKVSQVRRTIVDFWRG